MTPPESDNLTADLSAYLDGELDANRRREIEQLLEASDEARQLLDDLRTVSGQLADLPRVSAPSTLSDMMVRHAERQHLLDKSAPTPGGRILQLFSRVGAAAAVLLACVFISYQAIRPVQTTAPRVSGATPDSPERGVDAGISVARAEEATWGDKLAAPDASPAPLDSLGYTMEDAAIAAGPAASARPAVASESTSTANRDEFDFGTYADQHLWAMAPAPSGPVVDVVISPRTAIEYAAAARVLERWAVAAAYDGATVLSENRAAPIELSFHIPASELNPRLDELTTHATDAMHVRMSFLSRDRHELLQDIANPPAPLAAGLLFEGEKQKKAPASAPDDIVVATTKVTRGNVASESVGGRAAHAPKPAPGERGSRRGRAKTSVNPPPQPAPNTPAETIDAEEGDRLAQREEKAEEQSMTRRPASPLLLRIHHGDKGESATTQPDWQLPRDAIVRVLNYVFGGPTVVPSTQPSGAESPITFRIVLQPPPTPTSVPNRMPTSIPASAPHSPPSEQEAEGR